MCLNIQFVEGQLIAYSRRGALLCIGVVLNPNFIGKFSFHIGAGMPLLQKQDLNR